jgi:hypothetical protein
MNPWGLFFVAAGLFSLLAGMMNWDWFMNHPKARFVCGICGRGGARVFYVVLGAAFVVFGVMFLTGVIHDKR